jgi:glycosyltransferase involved in cell wall biosynthesis
MSHYGIRFWSASKKLGMRMIHTVHNVLPHEEANTDRETVRRVYEYSDKLIVHSEYSRRELLQQFPQCQGKELRMRFGLYTMFPRFQGQGSRLRDQLKIPEGHGILLFYGSVRPYKNIDSVLEALRDRRDVILVVAGRESGFSDLVPGDPLGRTRRIAASLGVLDRVRLIPGMLDLKTTAELFETADALLLPYLQSYGSGVLLLGMTFGLHIIATRTGGMDEYLENYPAHTLLDGPDTASVAQGIGQALSSFAGRDRTQKFELPHLNWRNVARDTLQSLESIA